MPGTTPFQTVGPYLHLGLRAGLEPMRAPGLASAVVIHGRLIDGAGEGISDGVLEFWAAGFDGLGRTWTGADGGYVLEAGRPHTRVEPGGAVHAPHFAVRVLGRGILTQYLTRVYFADDPDNERDVVLQDVPRDRRPTLLAVPAAPGSYQFDIVLQGERETVFFDV